MTEPAPKLFISYSWTSPEHEQWVLDRATELRQDGVDVILDKWDLKEGHDAHAFMEKMVTDPEIRKVALICDRLYAEKADGRQGGVGTETQIVSPEIYAKQDQDKFVAVVTETDEDGKPCLPAFFKSRVYIDFSNSDDYSTKYEQLLRWIFDKPVYIKPDLGKPPAYLEDETTPRLATTSRHRRALEAIRQNRPTCAGAVIEYFETLAQGLENFRISSIDSGSDEFDEVVLESIEQFLPYRNEAIDIFLALAQYRDREESWRNLHRFFESLIPYLHLPEGVTRYQEWDFDNFKFIIHELFLYAVASLLKYERFEAVGHLLQEPYYSEHEASRSVSSPVPNVGAELASARVDRA